MMGEVLRLCDLLLRLITAMDPLLFLQRTLLILGCIANTIVCWHLPIVRRIWISIGSAFLAVYTADWLRTQGYFCPDLDRSAYLALRQQIAIGSLNLAAWGFLLSMLWKRRV